MEYTLMTLFLFTAMILWVVVSSTVRIAQREALREMIRNKLLTDDICLMKKDYHELSDQYDTLDKQFEQYRANHPCDHGDDEDEDEEEDESDYSPDPSGTPKFSNN